MFVLKDYLIYLSIGQLKKQKKCYPNSKKVFI